MSPPWLACVLIDDVLVQVVRDGNRARLDRTAHGRQHSALRIQHMQPWPTARLEKSFNKGFDVRDLFMAMALKISQGSLNSQSSKMSMSTLRVMPPTKVIDSAFLSFHVMV